MKLICVVLTIILVGFQQSCGEELICSFSYDRYNYVGNLYSCFVTSLDNENNNMTITRHSGVHEPNKDENNVQAIKIENTNTKFIPANLGSLFELKVLVIQSSKLIEIRSTDFKDMQELEDLDLSNNNLKSLSVDVFQTLPMLRLIYLNSNKIKELSNGIFDKNLNLEQIHLKNNKIKFIAIGLFDKLTKLNDVILNGNLCIDIYYGAHGMKITQLKNDLEENCKNPNEVPATTITSETSTTRIRTRLRTSITTSTTQNSKELQWIEFEERIKKLEMELAESKNVQRMERIECQAKTLNLRELKEELMEIKDQIAFRERQEKLDKANQE